MHLPSAVCNLHWTGNLVLRCCAILFFLSAHLVSCHVFFFTSLRRTFFSETLLCRHILSPIRFPGRERSFHRERKETANHLSLWECVYKHSGSHDANFMASLCRGFPLVGETETSDLWSPFFPPAHPFFNERELPLRAWALRQKVIEKVQQASMRRTFSNGGRSHSFLGHTGMDTHAQVPHQPRGQDEAHG